MGSLRGTALNLCISSTDSITTRFCSQKLWGLTFLAPEPWAGGPGVGLGLLAPEIALLNFYLLHMDVVPACSASLPLLPVWMVVVSLVPQFSDFHLTHSEL